MVGMRAHEERHHATSVGAAGNAGGESGLSNPQESSLPTRRKRKLLGPEVRLLKSLEPADWAVASILIFLAITMGTLLLLSSSLSWLSRSVSPIRAAWSLTVLLLLVGSLAIGWSGRARSRLIGRALADGSAVEYGATAILYRVRGSPSLVLKIGEFGWNLGPHTALALTRAAGHRLNRSALVLAGIEPNSPWRWGFWVLSVDGTTLPSVIGIDRVR